MKDCVSLGSRIGSVVLISLVLASLAPQVARSQIVLNEVLADNRTAADNGDDFPDYIELLNTSAMTVNLGGMRLTDNPLSPAKYVFPANTLLAPGGYLVVFADENTNSPGIHIGFGMSTDGEDLRLIASNGITLLDSVRFGLQLPDRSIGRVPDGTGAWVLNVPSPAEINEADPVGDPALLRINEWMAEATKAGVVDSDGDWFEIYNGSILPVELGRLFLRDTSLANNHMVPPLTFMEPLGFLQIFADDDVTKGPDHVPFKLSSSSGEILTLLGADGATVIDQVVFGVQVTDVSQGRLPDGAPPPFDSFPVGRDTPEKSNFLLLTNVVFNEVLTHTDPPREDAVELFNPTTVPVDISGWWLSDDRTEPKKFRVPPNTVLAPMGYKVFYEGDFNPSTTGQSPDFTFNSFLGEEVNLFTANASGVLTGFRLRETFGAAQNGISFGRYIKSDGVDFVPMSRLSFGADNAQTILGFRMGTGLPNPVPKVGPVVINEIMYHPPDIISGTNRLDNSVEEYIELRNITNNPVNLFDPLAATNTWRLRDAVSFDFPMNVTLPGGGTLLVVNFDPVTNTTQRAAFVSKFNVPGGAMIFGPYKGKLQNKGDSVELYKPDPPQGPGPDFGFVPYILVDKVKYNDKAPWPITPDGGGASLHRSQPEAYANDAVNWTGAPPSPGQEDLQIVDSSLSLNTFKIRFQALAGSSYSLLARDSAGSGGWVKVADVPAQPTTGMREVTDPNLSGHSSRFYRLVTPGQ